LLSNGRKQACMLQYKSHIGSKGVGVEHGLSNGKGPCPDMLLLAVRVSVGVWIVVLCNGKEPCG
jgi:hypothetical protein